MLAGVRRLLALVCAVVFVDTMLFAAVIPLVPTFADDFGLSKLEAGLFVGAYGAGAMVGGIPSGFLAGRIGPKRTVVVGLVMLAVSSAAFALAGDPLTLALTRFGQGLASAVTWSGALAWLTLSTPRERRGQLLGVAFGFAILGFIVGPVVGAVAELTTIGATFGLIAALMVGLALVAGTFPPGRREAPSTGALGRALRDRGFLAAVWLTLVPALFFGALEVLAPLALDDAGWGTVAIAATFVCAGLIEVALAPTLGALSDERGRLYPVRLGLWGLAGVALALSFSTSALLLAGIGRS
jgi:MFS family permease